MDESEISWKLLRLRMWVVCEGVRVFYARFRRELLVVNPEPSGESRYGGQPAPCQQRAHRGRRRGERSYAESRWPEDAGRVSRG